MSFRHAYKVLSQREAARNEFTIPVHYPTPQHAFYSVVRSLKHRGDNRYSNILAYDRTAVCTPLDHSPGSKTPYLNANIVSDGKTWWVAAQAPTPTTFPHFFQAIYERTASKHPLLNSGSNDTASATRGKPAILVQLTGWEERGVPKADKYLADSTFGPLAVQMGEGEWREDLQSQVTTITINEMKVLHYHFEAWPDHGVPNGQGVEALRRLIREVEEKREGEVWVHW
jgi:protein-tyrosine phosphatase